MCSSPPTASVRTRRRDRPAGVLQKRGGNPPRPRRSEDSQAWRQPIDLVPLLKGAFEELPALIAQGRGKSWQPGASFTETLLGDAPEPIVAALNEALREGATPAQLAQEVATAAA